MAPACRRMRMPRWRAGPPEAMAWAWGSSPSWCGPCRAACGSATRDQERASRCAFRCIRKESRRERQHSDIADRRRPGAGRRPAAAIAAGRVFHAVGAELRTGSGVVSPLAPAPRLRVGGHPSAGWFRRGPVPAPDSLSGAGDRGVRHRLWRDRAGGPAGGRGRQRLPDQALRYGRAGGAHARGDRGAACRRAGRSARQSLPLR